MNETKEISHKPAHAAPTWQAPASTRKTSKTRPATNEERMVEGAKAGVNSNRAAFIVVKPLLWQ